MRSINPIIPHDYPDIDVIRINDTYYMISTTMYFMPGAEILKSYDLVNWEHETYVYDRLDSTEKQTLTGEANAYGKGMWAASLRYHNGTFYVCFVANDTGKTYLYSAKDIEGPWKKQTIEGFFHDCSLLFDENRIFIVYGNKQVYLTELESDFSGPKKGGLHRMIVNDEGNPSLGYEGSHLYKINGRYYVFFIHSLRDRWRRVEACFSADTLEDEFVGGDCFNDDFGYCNSGIAQGGIVDTPDGKWYAILFQDRGAIGRIPMLIPVSFENNQFVFGVDGKLPLEFALPDGKADYKYQPLVGSDDFKECSNDKKLYGSFGFKSCWQFNHEPDMDLIKRDFKAGSFSVTTKKVCANLTQAQNELTQRMAYPACEGEITIEASALQDGDYAGLAALQSCYGFIGLTRRDGELYLVMRNQEQEWEKIPMSDKIVRVKIKADFTNSKDEAEFFYLDHDIWKKCGITQKLVFRLDHFTGCRFALVMYSTKEAGGNAAFSDFKYEILKGDTNGLF